MKTYENISTELKEFFSTNGIFKILLPLDIIIMFGAIIVDILSDYISMGGLINGLITYVIYLGMLLTYANRKDQMLAGGFFLYAGGNALYVLVDLLFRSYHYLYWGGLFNVIIFGFLGYCILKKSYK